MSALLRPAAPRHIDQLLPLVAAYHAFEGIESSERQRRAALSPLLEGSPHGTVWLIGPERSPVGYVAVSFGWSIELGGLDGFVDEFFIVEHARGRGKGGEVLGALLGELRSVGMKALHLEVAVGNDKARRLYARHGFAMRDRYALMTWTARAGPTAGPVRAPHRPAGSRNEGALP